VGSWNTSGGTKISASGRFAGRWQAFNLLPTSNLLSSKPDFSSDFTIHQMAISVLQMIGAYCWVGKITLLFAISSWNSISYDCMLIKKNLLFLCPIFVGTLLTTSHDLMFDKLRNLVNLWI
jgi:hypothetical protein